MYKTIEAAAAFAMIEAGEVPTVMAGDSEFKDLLHAKFFSDDNPRRAWYCIKPVAYNVVNVGIGVQVDRVDWLVGQVYPKMTVISYALRHITPRFTHRSAAELRSK